MKYPNRAYRGSGCVGTRPVSRLERWAAKGKPARGRGSGTPFEDRPHIARRKRIQPGPHPHPTKRGPGRYA